MSTSPRVRKPSSQRPSDDVPKAIPEALFTAAHDDLLRIYNSDLRGADTYIYPFTPYTSERIRIPVRTTARRGADEQSDAKYVKGISLGLIGYQVRRTVDAGPPQEDKASVGRVIGRVSLRFKDGSLDVLFEDPRRPTR